MKIKYRIVTDEFGGFEVQSKRWWFPLWVQCWVNGPINTFISIRQAEEWVAGKKQPKFKSVVVKYL